MAFHLIPLLSIAKFCLWLGQCDPMRWIYYYSNRISPSWLIWFCPSEEVYRCLTHDFIHYNNNWLSSPYKKTPKLQAHKQRNEFDFLLTCHTCKNVDFGNKTKLKNHLANQHSLNLTSVCKGRPLVFKTDLWTLIFWYIHTVT